jgi:hypothetical protein
LSSYNGRVIPVAQLASLLETSIPIVNKLIRKGYLRGGKGQMVELPPRSALQWLKLMLQPLPLRPLFTVPEILELSGLTMRVFREIVLAWEIPLYFDPALGELISPDSLIKLINALHSLREPVRFDRAVLLNWMQGIGSNKQVKPKLPYSKLIELEIQRIAKLEEPARTISARAFYNAFKEARLVSHALNWDQGKRAGGNYEREKMIRELEAQAKDVLVDSTKPTAFANARKVARKARKRRERWARGVKFAKEINLHAYEPPSHPSHPPTPPETDPPRSPDNEPDGESR